jgi:hypothetical protein
MFEVLDPTDAPDTDGLLPTETPDRVREALGVLGNAVSVYDIMDGVAVDPDCASKNFTTAGQALKMVRAYMVHLECAARRWERAAREKA